MLTDSPGEPSEGVFRPLVRDLVNWRRREEGIGILKYEGGEFLWCAAGSWFVRWEVQNKGEKRETNWEVPKAGFCRGE